MRAANHKIPWAAQSPSISKHKCKSAHADKCNIQKKIVNGVTALISATCSSGIPNSVIAKCQPGPEYLPDDIKNHSGNFLYTNK